MEGLKAQVTNNDNDNDNNDYDDYDDDDKMLQVARKCLRLSIPRYMTDLTLGPISGEGKWLPPPSEVFKVCFFKTFKQQHLTFSVVVRLSLAGIVRQFY